MTFSSLFIGMGLAIYLAARDAYVDASVLSVPFSSGWALRSPKHAYVGSAWKGSFSSLFIGMGLAISSGERVHYEAIERFQFPFHRDGPCDSWTTRTASTVDLAGFQFPFHRDGPCDRQQPQRLKRGTVKLSVPFSSGWALRSQDLLPLRPRSSTFSSLFIGMGLAIWANVESALRAAVPFSSLFIGMGLAISRLLL